MPSVTPFLALVPILARGVWSDQPIYDDNLYSQYTDTHGAHMIADLSEAGYGIALASAHK